MRKKFIYNLILLLTAGSVVTSCDDVLDVNPESEMNDEAIWSTLEAADSYITASYKIFTDDTQLKGCRSRFWDSFYDITMSSSWDQYGHPYNMFLLQGLSNGDAGAGPFECWTNQYGRILTANICLTSLRTKGAKFGEDACRLREAEIRLCRAYSYFMLARVYGGVVLRTETSGSHGGISDGKYPEDVALKRSSEAETYQYILDELKFAAENLPDENSGSWPQGRAVKAFAYGLMSRVALYAKNYELAAESAEKCGQFANVALDSNFANLFSPGAEKSSEILFAIYYLKGNANLFHLWDNSVSPAGDTNLNASGAYGEHQPTAELADLYEWKDGTPFSWDDWSANHADPFTDREPRFQSTILYNGKAWRGRTIETFVGGVDGFVELKRTGSTGGKTCTGYFLRKFLQEDNFNFIESGDKSTTPDIIMRYGEVLLNQAEAYANLDIIGNQSKILDCINLLRRRVNLPDKTVNDVSDYEHAMKLIRDERAKELAAEGFRFWDLRRWNLAESVIGGQSVHGVKIVKAADGSFTYEVSTCEVGKNRVYPSQYKYFSIPLNERTNNPLCTNNPGW